MQTTRTPNAPRHASRACLGGALCVFGLWAVLFQGRVALAAKEPQIAGTPASAAAPAPQPAASAAPTAGRWTIPLEMILAALREEEEYGSIDDDPYLAEEDAAEPRPAARATWTGAASGGVPARSGSGSTGASASASAAPARASARNAGANPHVSNTSREPVRVVVADRSAATSRSEERPAAAARPHAVASSNRPIPRAVPTSAGTGMGVGGILISLSVLLSAAGNFLLRTPRNA